MISATIFVQAPMYPALLEKYFHANFTKQTFLDLGFNQIYGDFYEFRVEGEGFLSKWLD